MVEEKNDFSRAYVGQDFFLDSDKVLQQLQRILQSPEFHGTDRQREFLQFVVTETLAGRAEEIKGYTVATRVFGRKEDFDQAADPIVSIQANQLRRALERYYLVAGKMDPVRIDIPKGSYVPTFHQQSGFESDGISNGMREPDTSFDGPWPTLVIRPFQNLTDDPQLDHVAIGLATELAMEITRYQDIRVLMAVPESNERRISDSVARFAIYGNIRKDVAGIKVDVQLVDLKTNVQIWGDTHRYDLELGLFIAFQEHVARVVTAKISGEYGIIGKTLSSESRHIPPSDLKTYEAMLRYYEFNLTFSPESFYIALEALKLASSREPECGLVWSLLARLYAGNYSLELFNAETPLEEAASFAERGVNLDPANQRGRLILAYVLLFKNETSAGLAEAVRSLELNPNSLIFLENIGYLMTLFGDWERGPALIQKAIELNPYYSVIAHYALWVNRIRQGDYEGAYLETMNFRTPLLFWDPLLKSASCGLLGKTEEGGRAVESLLKLKPDFPDRGRVLIGHYIKFEDILERIIEGLQKAGLRIGR